MPRANRYFIPGYYWHITHRCHKKDFLLRFVRDRRYWIRWLFEARKRYGLCVLNYMVTSNHVHLLVKDTGSDVIPKSMQLVSSRIAQTYNRRKSRKGAFWEDRYHATAVQGDDHLLRCIVYIDMNMVRAGVVAHPAKWVHCGYCEIQQPPQRYQIIDRVALLQACKVNSEGELRSVHRECIGESLRHKTTTVRDPRWTESVAVGQKKFIESVKNELGSRSEGRRCIELEHGYQLKEPTCLYA